MLLCITALINATSSSSDAVTAAVLLCNLLCPMLVDQSSGKTYVVKSVVCSCHDLCFDLCHNILISLVSCQTHILKSEPFLGSIHFCHTDTHTIRPYFTTILHIWIIWKHKYVIASGMF